jgi:hypothetical protein
MSLWGVDISNHQPGADLAKAKAAGCSFVFAKATEGATYADPYFAGFRTKAAQLGLPLGAYHFARPQPGRTGAQEAGAFLHVVGTVRAGELPCVLDLEDTKIGPQATADWALEWLLAVHRATGVRPMVYTYSAFAAAKLFPAAQLATYPLTADAIHKHNDYFATQCPGTLPVTTIRERVRVALATPPLPPAPKPVVPTKGLNVKLIDLRDVSPYVTGPGVKPLQRLLGIPADGLAGPSTRAALVAAQKRCGLTADAVFGPSTAEALLAGK